MATVKHVLAFDGGELSPWLDGRTDLAKYAAGCRKLENFLVRPQGGISKRPGMQYCGKMNSGATTGVLVEFEIQGSDSLVLVLGGSKMKVFAGTAAVQSAGSDLMVPIPWTDSELLALRWKQLNDVMFFVHPLHAPQKLTRVDSTTWTLADFIPLSKPALLDDNVDASKKLVVTKPMAEAWSGTSVSYAIGDVVTYGDAVWRCILANTSTTANFPFSASTLWAVVADWSSAGVSYAIGARVTYGATVWICLVVNTSTLTNFPYVGSALWAAGSAWIQSSSYALGARVTYGGFTWISNVAHVSTTGIFPASGPDITSGFTAYHHPVPDGYFLLSLAGISSGTYTVRRLWRLENGIAGCMPGTVLNVLATFEAFSAGSVGGVFRFCRKRTASDSLVALAATLANSGQHSASIYVAKEAFFSTFGTWNGTFAVESTLDGNAWTELRSYPGTGNRNVSASIPVEAPCFVRITWTGTDGSSSPVGNLEVTEATMDGIFKITAVADSCNATAVAVTQVFLDTSDQWAEGAWSDAQGWPSCLELHQNRLLLASTTRAMHTIWGSAVDDYNNFYASTDADQPYRHTVIIGQREPIVWLASDRQLCIGSGIGEFTLRGEREDSAITPEFGVATRQGSFGSHVGGCGAIQADASTFFVQKGGKIIRELSFKYDSDRYEAGNMMLLSDHLMTDPITDWAYQRSPFQILWVVSGGRLYSMTYERGQNIAAWQRHPTAGTVVSVACLRSAPEDHVYFVMMHDSGPFTVERLTASAITAPADNGQWSDCWQTLLPPYTLTLNPLLGMAVVLWHNGQVYHINELYHENWPSGLSGPVVIGRPYAATVVPMTPEIPLPNGSTRSREARIHTIVPNLFKSRGGKLGQDPAGLAFDNLNAGSESALFTGEVEILFDGSFTTTGDYCLTSDQPFPFAVRSIALKMNFYGDS